MTFIKKNLIPILALLLGLSIPSSTAILTASYLFLLSFSIFRDNFKGEMLIALKEDYIKGCILFFMMFIIAIIWSNAPSHNITHMLLRQSMYILSPLLFVGLYKNGAKLVFKGFIIATFITVILSTIVFIFKIPILHGITDSTKWVIFKSHIIHSTCVAILSFVILWGVLETKNKKLKIFYSIIYILCFYNVFIIIESRTGELIFIISNLIVLIHRLKMKAIIIGVILILLSLPSLYKGYSNYLSDLNQYNKGNIITSMGLRKQFQSNAITFIKEKWILGYGTGSYAYTYKHKTSLEGIFESRNPHSDYLWILFELGIPGILMFITFMFLTFKTIFSLNDKYKCFGLSLFISYLLTSLQNSFFLDYVTGLTFIILFTSFIILGKYANKN